MAELFKVFFTKRAEKDLIRLRSLAQVVLKEILKLEDNPYAGHRLKGSLREIRTLGFSLYGVSYRAAYIVLEEEKICLVFMVAPHEGFYVKAERRAKTIKKDDDIRKSK